MVTTKALAIIFFLFTAFPVYAQTAGRSSDEIVRLSWKASSDGDLKALTGLADETIKNYGG